MKGVRLVCNYTHHNFINLGKNKKKKKQNLSTLFQIQEGKASLRYL